MHGLLIDVYAEGTYAIFDVVGELDINTAEPLKKSMRRYMEEGYDHLILDLKRVRYVDSSGLSLFIEATKLLLARQGRFSLVGCSQTVTKMLEITRLNRIVRTYTTASDALAAASRASGSGTAMAG